MFSGILSFLVGYGIPFISKLFHVKHVENIGTIFNTPQTDNNKEIILSNNEVKMRQLELEKSANEITLRANRSSSRVINVLIDVVRLLFGFSSVLVFLASAHIICFHCNVALLSHEDFTTAFFIILGFFFGERSMRKVWSNK